MERQELQWAGKKRTKMENVIQTKTKTKAKESRFSLKKKRREEKLLALLLLLTDKLFQYKNNNSN